MSREAMQQALEALESGDWYIDQLEMLVYSADDTGTHEERAKVQAAITALRATLAEPENQSQSQINTKVNPAEPAQKPVAWMCPDDPDRATAFSWSYGYCIDCGKPRIPLFTTPTGDSNG